MPAKAKIFIEVPQLVIMEEPVKCLVCVVPRGDVDIQRLSVEMVCLETGVSRGTTDHYSTKESYREVRIPVSNTLLKAREEYRYNLMFKLPELSTPTISAKNHWVEWFIRVKLDVSFLVKQKTEQKFTVIPYMLAKTPPEDGDENE